MNKSFRISCDEKDFNFKNPSLRTSEGNNKIRRKKNSKEISVLVVFLIIVKDSAFKAFKSFKVTFFSKIKKNSRVLKRL